MSIFRGMQFVAIMGCGGTGGPVIPLPEEDPFRGKKINLGIPGLGCDGRPILPRPLVEEIDATVARHHLSGPLGLDVCWGDIKQLSTPCIPKQSISELSLQSLIDELKTKLRQLILATTDTTDDTIKLLRELLIQALRLLSKRKRSAGVKAPRECHHEIDDIEKFWPLLMVFKNS